jgi:hypothetical protein
VRIGDTSVVEPLVFGHCGAPVMTSSDGERRTTTAKEIRSQSSPLSMYVPERLALGAELLIFADLVPECRRSCVWPPWSSRSSPPSRGRGGSGGRADEGRRGSGARRARRSPISSLLALVDGGRRGGRRGRRRGNRI